MVEIATRAVGIIERDKTNCNAVGIGASWQTQLKIVDDRECRLPEPERPMQAGKATYTKQAGSNKLFSCFSWFSPQIFLSRTQAGP